MSFSSHIVGMGRHLSTHDDVSNQDAFLTMGKKTGTIIELWQMATGLFPEIVDQYGEFSGEMLQVMLGVPIESKGSFIARIPEERTRDPKNTELLHASVKSNYEKKIIESLTVDNTTEREPNFIPATSASNSSQTFTIEDVQSHDVLSKAVYLPLTPHSTLAVNFDHGYQLAESESTFMLIEPDAPLILKMRRCERKLLPLLSSWMLVDVILTQFELVYLDALHCDHFGQNVALQGNPDAASRLLTSTKGGQDLLLCDVIEGRKIVGHVDLRSLGHLKVLRYLPDSSPEACDAHVDFQYFPSDEYWIPKFEEEVDTAKDPETIKEMNKKRWGRVEEDQLQICTGQGILHLRFLCDLKTQEEKFLSNSSEKAQMSEAMVWGNTLGQLRKSRIFPPIESINEKG
jgi:hypothetical protein